MRRRWRRGEKAKLSKMSMLECKCSSSGKEAGMKFHKNCECVFKPKNVAFEPTSSFEEAYARGYEKLQFDLVSM